MESNSNVVVAVRIRPLSSSETSTGQKSCCQAIGNVVAIKKDGEAGQYLKSQQLSINEYAYDAVFDENCSQQDVYDGTAKPFVNKVLNGENVTIFAYGATGAGKTHTMLGNTRADHAAQRADAGIIPNSVRDLFAKINNLSAHLEPGESYLVNFSYLEVYNEQVFDLLDSTGKVLSVREDQERGIVVVAGITEISVDNYQSVIDLILQGNRQRKTEATMANAVSSRSHAILQLSVRHLFRSTGGRETQVESKLSMIDLAGSERASATNNRGVRLQEGASINKSLLALANCINSLSEKAQSNGKKALNVKYRDSKLTHLLKSSLEGNCNLIMIANVNPSDVTYEDSHNTLKYANRAKNIKVSPVVKENQRDSTWLEREHRLRDENKQLKEMVELLRKEVEELRSFKRQVLESGVSVPTIDTALSASSDGYTILNYFDTAVSNSESVSTTCSVSVAATSTAAATSVTSKIRPRRATIMATPAEPMSTTISVTHDHDNEDVPTLSMPHPSDEPMPLNLRKRRASHLPTAVQSARLAKRRSVSSTDAFAAWGSSNEPVTTETISMTPQDAEDDQSNHQIPSSDAQSEEPAPVSESVEAEAFESVSNVPFEATSDVANELEELGATWDCCQLNNQKPETMLMQSVEVTSTRTLDDEPSADADEFVALPTIPRDTLMQRRSIASFTRKRSIAKVNAMLDSLTKDVSSLIASRQSVAHVRASTTVVSTASTVVSPVSVVDEGDCGNKENDEPPVKQRRVTRALLAKDSVASVDTKSVEPAANVPMTRRRASLLASQQEVSKPTTISAKVTTRRRLSVVNGTNVQGEATATSVVL